MDPNVLISARISPEGVPAEILEAAEANHYELIASDSLLAEMGDFLMRPKFRRHFSESAVSIYLDRLREAAILAKDPEDTPNHVPADSKDDYLIALAMNDSADLIVSGDGHLLDLKDETLPKILRPADFLERLRSKI